MLPGGRVQCSYTIRREDGSSDLAALGSIRLTAVVSNVRPSCRRPYGAGICKGMSCYIADVAMCSCSQPTNKNTCEEKCWHQAHPQPILCMALPRGRWHLPVLEISAYEHKLVPHTGRARQDVGGALPWPPASISCNSLSESSISRNQIPTMPVTFV